MGEESNVGLESTRVSTATGKPKHARHDEVERVVDDAITDLFDKLQMEFVYLGRGAVARGEVPMKPSDLYAALRVWDLEDTYKEWWHGDAEGEFNEDGDRWE